MIVLLAGLILFLGVHSLRIVADDGRSALVARFGEAAYKIAYSLLSLAGIILVVYGYGQAASEGGMLWVPPAGLRDLTLLLVPIAFVLIASAYLPTGRIKATAGHPMVLGIAVWALAHLLANGATASVVLFGAFFAWAVLDYLASLARDRRTGVARVGTEAKGDLLALGIGLAVALLFIFRLHLWLFGVSPLD